MDDAITGMPAETILHGALELSENSWLLALQFPDRAQPSLHPIVAISVVASVLSESATTISSTHSMLETAASRPGRAGFQHPVLHGRDLLATA